MPLMTDWRVARYSQLFPYPEDTLGYLKSRGLLLAANLHDALGVGNWDRQYVLRRRLLFDDHRNTSLTCNKTLRL